VPAVKGSQSFQFRFAKELHFDYSRIQADTFSGYIGKLTDGWCSSEACHKQSGDRGRSHN
jgi:hypothetical protein